MKLFMKLRIYLNFMLKVHFQVILAHILQSTEDTICIYFVFEEKQVGSGKTSNFFIWNIFQAAFGSVLIFLLLSTECIDGELRAAVCESCWSSKECSPCPIPEQICLASRAENELWAERIWLKCQSTQSPVEFPQKRLLQQRIVLTKQSCCVKFAATPCDE